MSGVLDKVLGLFAMTSSWELVAALLGLAYLLLAVRKSLWCWLAAFLSSAIYVAVMFGAKLYMQVSLNLFYVAMAVYGYWEWRRGRDQSGRIATKRWSAPTHCAAAVGVLALSGLNAWLLDRYSDAASPFLDSFVTWGSVITTWMVARRIIENWLYWIVVDGIAAYLYFRQDLFPTGVLFVIYIGIVIHGYRVWTRDAQREVQDPIAAKEESVT